MEPGIRNDLSNDTYHATAGISKSGLDLIARSPAHYAARYLQGVRQEPTPAMTEGTAFHAAALEPERFAADYVVSPDVRRGTKAWDAFVAKHPGREILKPADYDRIARMAEAVHRHTFARTLLTGGRTEQSVFWRDEETGVLCKCRPDYWRADNTIVDLKSTTDAGRVAFEKAVAKYRYHVQAAFFADGIHSVTGIEPGIFDLDFCFIAVEKEPPYGGAVYLASAAMVETGRRIYRENLALYADCLNAGIWPGYPETVQTIDLPRWAA